MLRTVTHPLPFGRNLNFHGKGEQIKAGVILPAARLESGLGLNLIDKPTSHRGELTSGHHGAVNPKNPDKHPRNQRRQRGDDQGAGLASVDFIGFGTDHLQALGPEKHRFTGGGLKDDIIMAPSFQRGPKLKQNILSGMHG
jgi:hypothetical protein